MKYQQLSKNDEWYIKDWLNSKFWKLITEYLEEQRESLTTGILSPVSEDRSKTIFNKRDMDIKELELIDEFLNIPQYLLTRISNQTDISAEDDR